MSLEDKLKEAAETGVPDNPELREAISELLGEVSPESRGLWALLVASMLICVTLSNPTLTAAQQEALISRARLVGTLLKLEALKP